MKTNSIFSRLKQSNGAINKVVDPVAPKREHAVKKLNLESPYHTKMADKKRVEHRSSMKCGQCGQPTEPTTLATDRQVMYCGACRVTLPLPVEEN